MCKYDQHNSRLLLDLIYILIIYMCIDICLRYMPYIYTIFYYIYIYIFILYIRSYIWWSTIVFVTWLTDESVLVVISSQDDCQRFSLSQTSDTPRARFKPTQNKISDYLVRLFLVTLTTTRKLNWIVLYCISLYTRKQNYPLNNSWYSTSSIQRLTSAYIKIMNFIVS